MRKLITYILLLAIVCSLAGCGRVSTDTTPTEPPYSMQDLLLKQATDLAQRVGLAVQENYLLSLGITQNVAVTANVFSAASNPESVTSATLLRTDRVDLPQTLSAFNSNANDEKLKVCVSSLQFTTQFYSELQLSDSIGVLLQYSNECFFVVLFESGEHQLIRATVYPLSAKGATMLMNKYYPNAKTISQETILAARANAATANFLAAPVGGGVTTSLYLTMAKYMLTHSSVLTAESLYKYASSAEVRTTAIQYSKFLCSEVRQSAVYRFPADLETASNGFTASQVKDLANQNAYLGWVNALSANFGDNCLTANSILNDALHVSVPRSVIEETEVPVLVALDFGDCTGIITLYPNEYNTYLYTVTCLPCTFAEATGMLTQYGAGKM